MAFTMSPLRTSVAPEAIAGEFAQERKRRHSREDLQRILGIIGGVGDVVGIGRGISGIATDISRRKTMATQRGGLEDLIGREATQFGQAQSALQGGVEAIAGPRPPAPRPEAPPGFPASRREVPRELETVNEMIARAAGKGAGLPGMAKQLAGGIAVRGVGGRTGIEPRPGTEAAGAGLSPVDLEAREREARVPLARIAEAPPTEDLTGPSGTQATLGALTQIPIARQFSQLASPVGDLIASVMDMAPDPAAVEAGAAPGIAESKGVRDWGQALEESLRQTVNQEQKKGLLTAAEEAVTVKYAGNTELRDWMLRIIESLKGGGRAFGAGRR